MLPNTGHTFKTEYTRQKGRDIGNGKRETVRVYSCKVNVGRGSLKQGRVRVLSCHSSASMWVSEALYLGIEGSRPPSPRMTAREWEVMNTTRDASGSGQVCLEAAGIDINRFARNTKNQQRMRTRLNIN